LIGLHTFWATFSQSHLVALAEWQVMDAMELRSGNYFERRNNGSAVSRKSEAVDEKRINGREKGVEKTKIKFWEEIALDGGDQGDQIGRIFASSIKHIIYVCMKKGIRFFIPPFFRKKGARAGERTRELLISFVSSLHHFTAEPFFTLPFVLSEGSGLLCGPLHNFS
jgi:hypothetical protein